ncbi:APC family permease [Streptomyces mashuensis]|uniref:APC family permease n=1 Tax=Streptomyces mashuensis TaxID=33904 RepID=UPI00167DAE57|nr:APC family permease [Streptomyces mashuensis]
MYDSSESPDSDGQPVVTARGDEARRLSVFDLIGLAAGGMIGSGWLFAALYGRKLDYTSLWIWVADGALMLVLAVVMVELGTARPKTGGLIFLPLQSSGPLVAIIMAAGLWIFYVTDGVSQAFAMTKALSLSSPGLWTDGPQPEITRWGLVCATALLAVFAAVNLLPPRLFVTVVLGLTVWKVLVSFLVVAALFTTGHHGAVLPADLQEHCRQSPQDQQDQADLHMLVSSSVLFSYVGFQLPLDFAGHVKQKDKEAGKDKGIGEATRLRRAVYGSLAGAFVLYVAAQLALLHHSELGTCSPKDPRTIMAVAKVTGVMTYPFLIDALVAPLATGLVFAHALTREVAALSAAHLTHRNLRTIRGTFIKVRGRSHEVYWKVLLVNFAVGAVIVTAIHGSWEKVSAMNGTLMLVVYAMPGVVLVALSPECSRRRRIVRGILARVGFLSIALVLFWVQRDSLWYGMAALLAGCVLLLGLPALARSGLPVLGRGAYDAQSHLALLRQWRTNPAAGAGVLLLAYLAALTLLRLLPDGWLWQSRPAARLVVLVLAAVVFEGLVRLSGRHIRGPGNTTAGPPPAPAPAPVPAPAPAPDGTDVVTPPPPLP